MLRLVVILTALIVTVGCGSSRPPDDPTATPGKHAESSPCPKSPCVTVSPDPHHAKRGDVLTYRGTGWQRRKDLAVDYQEFCDPKPGEVCMGTGKGAHLTTDEHGRFEFHLVLAPTVPAGTRAPARAGGPPTAFEQTSGSASDPDVTRRGAHVVR